MLLNLSNHPSVHWTPEQFNAAQKQYGRVEDMPFPPIPPEADTEGVLQIAYEYAEKIKHYPTPVTHVHLMGEMTFVVALVPMLQSAGIGVVCSTTERIVLEEKDGKKTLQFRFCRFRVYPDSINTLFLYKSIS